MKVGGFISPSYLLFSKNCDKKKTRISSPIGHVCVLFRIEGDENNIILGTLSREAFFRKLQNKDLRFNMAYIISK